MFRVVGLCTRIEPPARGVRPVLWLVVLWATASLFLLKAADPGHEFFEARIRPVLVESCYPCHSQAAEKVKAGLMVDTRDGLLKGGQSGPALVPGDPEQSLVIKAVRYTNDELQMPPKGKKLSAEHIAALEAWVRMGAPDPRTGSASVAATPGNGAAHWAFQPVRRPPAPEVRDRTWVLTPIDAFILAKLEARDLSPSPRADKRTLLRRASFDVIGLPPTPDEMAAFLADQSPNAFERVVDRLLASPQYGERWARHWLDVARYADTKGYVFEEERRYPYAYTYRDYVIAAFNEDLPFDKFVVQQIAADQLDLGEDKRPLAALGYLTLGRRFLNNTHDIIDDRIDVVARGMMGLTVGCARCHDHKFDPITMRDYYALYGVFANCSEPEEKPALGAQALPAKYAEYQEEHQRRARELAEFQTSKSEELRAQLRRTAGDYLLAAHEASRLPDASAAESLARERKLDPPTVQRWKEKLAVWRQGPRPLVLEPWFALADCGEEDEGEAAARRIEDALSGTGKSLNPWVAQRLVEPLPTSVRQLAERYNQLFADLEQIGSVSAEAEDASLSDLGSLLVGKESPALVSDAEITRLFDVPSIQKLRALRRKVEELDATHPGAPPRAMALQDNPAPRNYHVLLRGNPANQGPEVPRQFLAVLSGGQPRPFEKGSGRLELAQAVASQNNPLTARVFVNRVWMHYFGAGLVGTASDFGLRSEPPTHPELLDYLAASFMDGGWSVKKLQRQILLSSVYQQASEDNASRAAIDPANQLLWRMNRRRLDFEAMRDSLLAVAGNLDRTVGGRSVDIVSATPSTRRTLYGFVERQNLPGVFRTFDFATPDTTSPGRFSTTVPQQALFMMNSPFAIQESRLLVRRVEGSGGAGERVRSLYQVLYQREPADSEVALASKFIEDQASALPYVPPPPAWQYGYGEYDVDSRQLRTFHPLPHFTGDSWQGGAALPDPKLGWVHLRAGGGHPGGDHRHAAVLRWTAPFSGDVQIVGTLGHGAEAGDGVRAWAASSRSGEVGAWVIRHGKQTTDVPRVAVQAGDVIDFVVDCGGSVDSDGYTWSPLVRRLDADQRSVDETVIAWDARQEFHGPVVPVEPLSPWERYVQVLLMSNELVFVD